MATTNNNDWNSLMNQDISNPDAGYLKMVDNRKMKECRIYTRIEPRTRNKDFASALSFEVFDPLWMLTRQWQFGRFNGVDGGSALTAKIKATRRKIDSTYPKRDVNNKKNYSIRTPMEYEVEKMNRSITPFVRIESALYFKKMLELKLSNKYEELVKTALFVSPEIYDEREIYTTRLCNDIITGLKELFHLDSFTSGDNETNPLEILKLKQNENLKRLYAVYGKRIFDGCKLYLSSDSNFSIVDFADTVQKINEKYQIMELNSLLPDILLDYKTWFDKKYLPVKNEEDNCWNEQKLGYEVSMGESTNVYEAEDYCTGKLSWYSFDGAENPTPKKSAEQDDGIIEKDKWLSYLPVPAILPGAPARRLWQFEDVKVRFGQQENNEVSMLANAVVMQYVTMYGNDWMLTPIETVAGTILDVEGIMITDTFGNRIFIDTSAEEADKKNTDKSVSFTDRWSLFGTTKANAYNTSDFSSEKGLLFPPTLPRCEESKPVEEVQFLRDEMANMLWGVENIINDGCGGTISGKNLSDAVLSVVDAQKEDTVDTNEGNNEYSFLVQNRVPIHWIPFIPQKIPGKGRDIRFRRGTMPIYFTGEYNLVRPSTELLKIKIENDRVVPRYINEEEITGYGVKLILTNQRTRWFFGKSFNWTGAKKIISQYQANSGLMFDELIEKKSNQAIKLDAGNSI